MRLNGISNPGYQSPFVNQPAKEIFLWNMIELAQQRREAPSSYGFRPGERGYGEYENIEELQIGGRHSKKQQQVKLPERVWLPRCVLWVQALEAMTELLCTI